MVTQLDLNAGRVLDCLEQSTYNADTIRVYLSDHGEMAGEHGMWWKSNFYEASVRVPMIWSWPGQLPQGISRKELVSLLDVGPTLEAFAGYDGPHTSDGHSLMPLLHNAANDPKRPAEVTAEMVGSKMIRSGPWKLIAYHGYPDPQLFNLEADPGEVHDRANDRECAAIRHTLFDRLCQGWNPEKIQHRIDERKDDVSILSQWASATQPAQHHLWQAPTGVNQFPLSKANN